MAYSAKGSSIDEFCAQRRQGDFARTPCTLVIQTGAVGGEGLDVEKFAVEGVVIVTQTCDIVGGAASDPYVQVARLFEETREDRGEWLASGHEPKFVPIPGTDGLFADLSVTATVDKAALLNTDWERTITSTQEANDFAYGIGRKSSRFPFPDEFQTACKKLRDRIRKKYGKPDSAEGRTLTKVRQIRAHATPDWSSETYAVTLTFIVDPSQFPIGAEPDAPVEDAAGWINHATIDQLCQAIENPAQSMLRPLLWQTLVEKWAALCTPTETVTDIDAEVAAADEFTAADMWTSQRLDMDYLSDDEDMHAPDP